MKKWIVVILVAGFGAWIWNKYGYLRESVRNQPMASPLSDTRPTSLPLAASDEELSYINLAEGYKITYFAKDVPGARSMTKGDTGVVYVGTRTTGVVYALEDADGDGRAETRYVVASGLNSPNGVAYLDGNLYVAELSRIIKFENIDTRYKNKPEYLVVYDKLPKDTQHGWKYLAAGPDGQLYIPIGMPCNVCSDQGKYGRIIRINPREINGGLEVVATGIRNTVGYDWDPSDGSLWFTDNGRDWLGDDAPEDELNHVFAKDLHFGFPYCHAGEILDPEWGKGKSCEDYVAPFVKLGAHVAALGMKFVEGKMLVAEHGSWNRSTPVGYRVTQVDPETGSYEVLAEGWLTEGKEVLGRPVDILELDDGSILISDDFAGAVYRITR